MENLRAVINNGDGTVGILIPAKGCGLTFEQIVEKDAKGARIVTTDQIPRSRLFREAWTDDLPTDTVDVDLSRAKGVGHGMRREVRAKKFAPLDVMATIPAEASAAEIARQKVRDDDSVVQSSIDDAQDVEALEAIVVGYV